MEKSIISFIPIRDGSQGLYGKNMKVLNGKPLYMYSVELSLNMKIDCVISTDIKTILESKDLDENITLIKRPNYLCNNQSKMEDVILHFIDTLKIKDTIIILLQATSPLRRKLDVQKSLDLFLRSNFELVMTVKEVDNKILKSGFVNNNKFKSLSKINFCYMNRQDLPKVYCPNGAVYIFNSDWFKNNKGFETKKTGVILMDSETSIDIDTIQDFNNASDYFSNR